METTIENFLIVIVSQMMMLVDINRDHGSVDGADQQPERRDDGCGRDVHAELDDDEQLADDRCEPGVMASYL